MCKHFTGPGKLSSVIGALSPNLYAQEPPWPPCPCLMSIYLGLTQAYTELQAEYA